MISFLLFLCILGLLIIVHECGHFIVARLLGVRVEVFSLGFGPQLFSRKRKDTQYTLSAIPLGGYVKLAGDTQEEYTGKPDEFLSQAPLRRLLLIFCGPFLNYVLGFLCFWFIFWVGYPTLTTKVGGLVNGLGAQEAGIQVGDTITAVDGTKVKLWEELANLVHGKKDATRVSLSVLRGLKQKQFDVTIKAKPVDDLLGQKRTVGLLGITPLYDEVVEVRHGFIESFSLGLKKTVGLTRMVYQAFWLMLSRKISVREVTGPLGLYFMTSQVASQGIIMIVHFIAVISINLAIFNLLPLPMLDGGHVFLLAVEKVRRRKVSVKTEQVISRIGISFIVALAILVIYNDILRFQDKIFKWFTK